MRANITRKMQQGFRRISNIPAGLSLLPGAATILLIAVSITMVSFLGVDIFYKIVRLKVAGSPSVAIRQTATMAATAGQGRSIEYDHVIAKRNLFQTARQAIYDENAGGNLPPREEYTAFDLKGTMPINQAVGYAIVEEKGQGKQKLYRIGERIGQARLIRITRNTAVLKDGEKEFVMKIKESAEGPLSGRSPRPGSGIAVNRQEVTQSLGDLKSIMSQAVVRPFLVEGVQQGFIVSSIVPGSLYQKLGLQNGDVVVDVNNKKLESADDILRLVNTMQAGGSVSVKLMRNGQNETINYSFN